MIKQWCQELSCFPETVWISYAKSREPLSGRLSLEDYASHFHAARKCGMDLADQIRREWGDICCQELAEKLGVRVERLPMPDGNGMLTFACFYEPDRIELFTDNAEATETLIRESGGIEFLDDVDICDMLLAHELFHALQDRYPDLYVHRKLVRLWKIGPFIRDSKLLSLEEVAAMAFAQRLLNMRNMPYLYDVLMLLPQATGEARKLYEKLQSISEEVAPCG